MLQFHIRLEKYPFNIKQIGLYIFSERSLLEVIEPHLYTLISVNKDLNFTISLSSIPENTKDFTFYFTAISKTNNESRNSKIYEVMQLGNRWTIK